MHKFSVLLLVLITPLLTWARPAFKGISNHNDYVCGHTDSKVYCWGDNKYGQTQTIDGFSEIKEIQTQEKFACVSDSLGITCWGQYPALLPEMITNDKIESLRLTPEAVCILSEGKILCTGESKTPSELKAISDFSPTPTIVSTITCGVDHEKGYCWNKEGVLLPLPQDLGPLQKIITNGKSYCALSLDQSLNCWGKPSESSDYEVPTGLKNITDVQMGVYHVCATHDEGKVTCWGSTIFGGVTPTLTVKAEVLTGGDFASCIMGEDTSVSCWGLNSHLLLEPPFIANFDFMSANYGTTCFVLNDELSCSGESRSLQHIKVHNLSYLKATLNYVCLIDDLGPRCLGDNFPSFPDDLKNATQLSASWNNICAIVEDGKLRCWTSQGVETPGYPESSGIKKISSGLLHFCALLPDQAVSCWGHGSKQPPLSMKAIDIISGNDYDCALLENEEIQCWTLNENAPASILTPPTHLVGIKSIQGGEDFACALTETEVSCWGDYADGKLIPPRIVGKIKHLAVGGRHACLEDEEEIKCWGNNVDGQYQFLQE